MKRLISALLIATVFCSMLCFGGVIASNEVNYNENLLGEVSLAEDNIVAFPGAEGGGMYTTGARASNSPTIYHVTSLSDSGKGSLRDAVSGGENRIVVFDIAGTINLEDYLNFSKDNITVLGQTSPGDGICIAGAPTKILANNIILRYLRFRMGVYSETELLYDDDAFGGTNSTNNLIVDHCSMSWANDECCSVYAVKDSTIQWCVISEPLNKSIHYENGQLQDHGYGGIWGGVNVSYHHNLVSSAKSRFPRVGTSQTVKSYNNTPDTESLLDIRNNVFYNWQGNNSYGGENMTRVNIVNNYYKMGPASSDVKRFYEMTAGKNKAGTDLAIGGNYYDPKTTSETITTINADNTKGVKIGSCTTYNNIPYDESVPPTITNHTQYINDFPILTDTADEAYEKVLENAGCSIVRDDVDIRFMNDVRNRTGVAGNKGIVDLSHFKTMTRMTYTGTKETDTDGDGMVDSWEDANGLNKNDSSDALAKATSTQFNGKYTGYYNIEVYSFQLANAEEIPPPSPKPTIDPNAPTATPLPTAKPTATPGPSPTRIPEQGYNAELNISGDGTAILTNSNGAVFSEGKDDTYKFSQSENYENGKVISVGDNLKVTLGAADDKGTTKNILSVVNMEYVTDVNGVVYQTHLVGSQNASYNKSTTISGYDNPPNGGTFYVFNPSANGRLEVAMSWNTSKAMTVIRPTLNGITGKYMTDTITGKTYSGYTESPSAQINKFITVDLTAGETYYMFFGASKPPTYGFSYSVMPFNKYSIPAGETVFIQTTANVSGETAIAEVIGSNGSIEVVDNKFVMPEEDVAVNINFGLNLIPTSKPTDLPTATPTLMPTATPTGVPTATPTLAPTEEPIPTMTPKPILKDLYTVESLENLDNGASVVVTNNTDESGEKVKVIIASYTADDILLNVEIQECEIGYQNTETISTDFVANVALEKVKVFIWNKDLKPLSQVYIVE